MTWWPWRRRPEVRSAGYTDLLVGALLDAAAAGTAADDAPLAVGAVETAAGAYARAFAAADVVAPDRLRDTLSPGTLAALARHLVRRGESVHLIDVSPVGVRLRDVAAWDVRGGPDPETWTYDVDLRGPDRVERRRVPAAGIVHVRYAVDPMEPWRGIAPLTWARRTGRLAGQVERVTGDEASGPTGQLVAVPEGQPDDTDADGDGTSPLATLRADLVKLKGGLTTVETTAQGWGDKGNAPTGADWMVRRFGPNPPAALVELRAAVERSALAVLGVPDFPAMDGTGQRESWRRFLHGSVAPLARIVEAELSAKLEVPVRLSFADLHAHDRTGQARAWRSLVGAQGAMPDADARRLAGLG